MYQIFKLEKGEWPFFYPLGYSVPSTAAEYHKSKRTKYSAPQPVFINEKEKLIVQDIFELYATGKYSLKKVAEMVSAKHTIKTYASTVGRMLDNKFYIGIMEWNGKSYKHKYPVFISKDLFDQVQEIKKFTNLHKHLKKTYAEITGEVKSVIKEHKERTLPQELFNTEDIMNKFNYSLEEANTFILDQEILGNIEQMGADLWKPKA